MARTSARVRRRQAAVAVVAVTLGAACASCGSGDPVPVVPPGCNPISLDSCYLPYPSSFYQQADPGTVTGVRMSWPAAFLPDVDGVLFDPGRLADLDGASPATPIVVYFKDGIDVSGLPTLHTMADSADASARLVVLDAVSGARVPYFVELDANTIPGPTDRQALLVRPLHRLAPATRHVVAFFGDLKDGAGAPLQAPLPFRALRDGLKTSRAEVVALQPRYEEIFGLLQTAGVPREQLILAWDFVTASDAAVTGPLVSMRDDALRRFDEGGYGYTATEVNENHDPHILRQVIGTFEVPWYLDSQDKFGKAVLDSAGLPTWQRKGQASFILHVPKCAETATGPLRIMVFGHGLFESARYDIDGEYHRGLADELCVVELGTDWLGFSVADRNQVVQEVLLNMSALYLVTDKAMQGHVNFHVLTRLVLTALKDDPLLTREGTAGGTPVTDGAEIYYYGCSNGAIQGTGFVALSPDVARGVLNVGGGPWSLMMQRSTDFSVLAGAFVIKYPDTADQQLLFAVWQSYFDFIDPATWAGHLLRDPLSDLGPKRVILHESLGDAQVPNLASRYTARTAGLTALAPLLDPPFGISSQAGPLESAYVQWNVHPSPLPPENNITPKDDNQAHDAVRRLPETIEQLDLFFRPDGQAVQTCAGAAGCDFPSGQ
ncbi:MAG: hypothetical protein HY906_28105 [Deltaproteobacteria bacterium]|nr:hypothetical protein [Deltaproteobacteria bacterium]